MNIQFERIVSVKALAHILMMGVVVYLYITIWKLHDSNDLDITLSVGDLIHYNVGISDFTFLCGYIILRMMLYLAEELYYIHRIVCAVVVDERKRRCLMMCFLFCWLRVMDLQYYLDDEAKDEYKYRLKILNMRIVNFELLFVRFFCPEETTRKFRRRYSHWSDLAEADISLHKDLVCGLFACAATFIVKFFVNYQYVQRYMSKVQCAGQGHHCTTSIDDDNCWCTVNLIGHAPTFIFVVVAGVFGVFSFMRAVVTYVFDAWLEPKYEKATWFMSTRKCGREDKMTLPQNADVAMAVYGLPKNGFRDKLKKLRKHNNCTLPELTDLYSQGEYWIVTDHVRYYLTQGTTTFSLKPHDANPIMIVKGAWNGGRSSYDSKVRRRIECDAIQSICISMKYRRNSRNCNLFDLNEQSGDERSGSNENRTVRERSGGNKKRTRLSIIEWVKGGREQADLIWEQAPPGFNFIDRTTSPMPRICRITSEACASKSDLTVKSPTEVEI